jgi:hypothetical protein
MMSGIRLSPALALSFLFLSLPQRASGEEVLRVEGPRPLLAAIHILEEKFGWQIIYEDPPYTNPGDSIDRTPPTYNGPGRIIEPRIGRLEVTYQVTAAAGTQESAAAVLQMLIDDHDRRQNAGRFRLGTLGDLLCVVPAQGSILDTPVTFPGKQRNFEDSIQEIVRSISRATGLRMRLGPMPPRISGQFELEAKGEAARNVLLRLLGKVPGHRFSWTVLYGPHGGHELSVKTVRGAKASG